VQRYGLILQIRLERDAIVQLARAAPGFWRSRRVPCATARGAGGLGEDGCVASQCPKAGDAPRAFPTRDGTAALQRKGRRAAGAVPRDPVVCRRGRNPCDRDRRVEQIALRHWAQTAASNWQQALAKDSYISRHAVYATPSPRPARLRRYASPRAPHAAYNQVRLDCSHCQSSATRHPLRA
jgi:hypothetical protein